MRTNIAVGSKKMSPPDHYRVSPEQADGKFELKNGKNASGQGDLFGPDNQFTPTTKQNSHWWIGFVGGFGVFRWSVLVVRQR
jgi:hypothetical protein